MGGGGGGGSKHFVKLCELIITLFISNAKIKVVHLQDTDIFLEFLSPPSHYMSPCIPI